MRRPTTPIRFLLITLALVSGRLLADDPPPASGIGAVMPNSMTPGAPAGSYALHDFDRVNLATRHLSVSLPLAPSLGRGQAKIPFALALDPPVWRFPVSWTVQSCDFGTLNCTYTSSYGASNLPDTNIPFVAAASLSLRRSGADCHYEFASDGRFVTGQWWMKTISTFRLIEADGTQMEFVDTLVGGQPLGGLPASWRRRGTTFMTHDGSGAILVADADVYDIDPTGCLTEPDYAGGGGATITFRDGTAYRFVGGGLSWVRDRNGNKVTSTTSGYQDSLGRTTSVSTDWSGHTTVVYPGYQGAQRTVTLSQGATLRDDWNARLVNGDFGNCGSDEDPLPCMDSDNVFGGSLGLGLNGPLLSNSVGFTQVQLPNLKAYTLRYDIYGNVARIELPTGGAYEYDYDYAWECHPVYSGPCILSVSPLIKEKRVYANASDNSTTGWVQKIKFSGYPGYQDPPSTQPTVVDFYKPASPANADGVLAGREKHYFHHTLDNAGTNGNFFGAWKDGREYQTEIYDSDGTTLLKTTTSDWHQRPCETGDRIPCAWLTSVYGANLETPGPPPASTMAPAHDPRVRTETVTYGALTAQADSEYDSFNNKTSVTEYDFSTTPPGARLRKTTTTYVTASAYTNLNLIGLPLTQTILDSSDATVAQTTWTYDEADPDAADCASLIQHDSSFGTSYRTRGNATSTGRLLLDPIHPANNGTLTTRLTFDILGNVKKVQDPRNATTEFSYTDSAGACAFPTTVKHYLNPGGSGTSLLETVEYDYSLGKAAKYTDVNQQPTSYFSYFYDDALDRMKRATHPDGGETTFDYTDTPGNVNVLIGTKLDSSRSQQSYVYYDGLGRKIRSEQVVACPDGASNAVVETHYDSRGRVSQVSNPYCPGDSLAWTSTSYDGLDRPITVTTPDNSVSTSRYAVDTASLRTLNLEIDPAGHNRLYYSDAAGRLTRVDENATSWPGGSFTNPFSAESTYATQYGYNTLGDLLSVDQTGQTGCTLNGVSHSRCFAYDSLKRLLQAQNPENDTISYTYDFSGNLASRTSPGVIKTLAYDGLNRVTGATYTDATPPVSYCYDNVPSGQGACQAPATGYKGRLTSVSNGNSRTLFTSFDAMGRVTASTQKTGGQDYTFGYTYNLAGALTGTTYPSGRTLPITYDTAGRATSVGTYATGITYWPHGAIHQMTLGNTLSETTAFNSRLQPTQIQAGSLLTLGLDYGSDATKNNGNLFKQTETIGGNPITTTYKYDAVNRLAAALELPSITNEPRDCAAGNVAANGWCHQYGYDQFGNRTITSRINNTAAADEPFSFNPNNNRIADANWTYTTRGEVSGTPSGATYAYDGEGRMTSATVNGVATQYVYDGDGRRVKKVQGATATTYVYGATGQLAAEYGPLDQNPPCTTCYLAVDHLGSTRLVTNATGAPVERHDYEPFGRELLVTANSPRYPVPGFTVGGVPLKFTGKERDAETGLDFFGARYMSSAQGRFTSTDPNNPILNAQMIATAGLPSEAARVHMDNFLENPQNWNRYAYVRNNPLAFVDPFGQEPVGHHLIPMRGQLTGLAREFTEAVRTGAPNVAPNIGYGAGHRAYSAAVEEVLQGVEQEFGAARNSWGLSQWRDAATRILNSNVPAIRNFLDTFNRNQGGKAISTLAAAIKAYRPSAGLISRMAIAVLGEDLLMLFRMPMLIMVDPAITNPQKRMQEEIKNTHRDCLIDRKTGSCVF